MTRTTKQTRTLVLPALTLLLLALVAALPAPLAAQSESPPAGADAVHPGAVQGPGGAFRVHVTGEGPPLVLIPGLASAGEVWDGVVERYRDRYELHVLTLAGFAGVPALDGPDFLPVQRDAVVEYIREKGLDAPVLVGHSLGGFLALWVAASAPELVGGVVAVDGVPFLTALGDTTAVEGAMATEAEQAAAFYASMTPEQMEAQTRMAARAMVTDTARAETITAWGAASDPATAGRAYAEMMTTDLRDDLASVEAPIVLVMAGSGRQPDALERARLAYAHQLRSAPSAELVVAPDARHFVMYDDPELLYRTLDRFLAGLR